MFLARVTGSVVSTHKVESMVGQKLLTVDPLRIDATLQATLKPLGRTFIAVDLVGAGEGQIVMIVQGSSARMTDETAKLPIDAAIIGLVNEVSAHGKEIYSSSTSA
ncbi:Ethanolamine utilization protein EutN [Planctomycetes bacterium Pan216]|uniref:Ethanolamine utilization protein EutN n=1 Tax=Kolteria novifilia TaxID=2527975 RepID=A0A518B9M0_9BACT|nr:Ethanolamine utilization protein EutN [Planctomycetes bacterium Pan216]